jgi:hypothetical protein
MNDPLDVKQMSVLLTLLGLIFFGLSEFRLFPLKHLCVAEAFLPECMHSYCDFYNIWCTLAVGSKVKCIRPDTQL